MAGSFGIVAVGGAPYAGQDRRPAKGQARVIMATGVMLSGGSAPAGTVAALSAPIGTRSQAATYTAPTHSLTAGSSSKSMSSWQASRASATAS